jgi:hypothetical protein
LQFTNATGSTVNLSGSLTAGTLLATTNISTASLSSINSSISNVVVTNISASSINVSENITTGALTAVNASMSNLNATNSTITNVIFTNASGSTLNLTTSLTSNSMTVTGSVTTGAFIATNSSITNLYFAWPDDTLSKFKVNNILAWISGHTHWSYDFCNNNIRLISNQLGYESETEKTGINEDGLYEINIS